MKKRLLTVPLALGLAFVPAIAFAQTTQTDRLAAIQQRCTIILTTLDQIQRHDLVARTNRGRSYEDQIKQINALSQRMHNNNMGTQTLDGPANGFKNTVDAFRSAYVQYDDGMNRLRHVDCRTNPVDFSIQLEQTKILREEVGAEVTKGEQFLAQYREAVVALQATLAE
jgi:hypothetical protein